MRPINLLIAIITAAGMAACGPTQAEWSVRQTEVASLSAGQDNALSALAAEQTRSADLAAELTRAAGQSAGLSVQLTQQAAAAATQAAASAAQLTQLTTQRDQAAANYQDLLERIHCQTGRSTSFDLSEHASVSRGLKTLIADYEDTDPTASWETLPGHLGSAIHRVYGREAWVFVVSLAAQDAARGTSVFWVEEQCFLDIPGAG